MAHATAIQVEIRKAIKPLSERLSEYGKNFIEENDKLAHRIGRLNERLGSLETEESETQEGFKTLHSRIDQFTTTISGEVNRLANKVSGLYEQVEALIKDGLTPPTPSISELYTALVAAQLEIKNAEANISNEFLNKRYADLASVMDAVREPLAKNGLVIIQLTATIEEVATVDKNPSAIGIKTTMAHTSGHCIVDIIAMVPPKMDPQGIGSCRTYMRRYGVLGICAIAGAIDDDAEGTKKGDDEYERINSQEAEAIIVKADELFGDRADAALAKMLDRLFGGIQRVGDIKAGEADVAVTSLANAAELMAKTAAKKDKLAKQLADQEKADKAEHDEEGGK